MMNEPVVLRIIKERIHACDVLTDYILDDIPHARQQPLLDQIRELRSNFNSDLDSEISDIREKMEAAQ